MNIQNLSDAELATYVDEYVKRAMRTARSNGCDGRISIGISASQTHTNADFEIAHEAEFGYYPKNIRVQGCNAIVAASKVAQRWYDDKTDKPTLVTLELPAPTPTPAEEYAEFDEVEPDDANA